MNDNGTSEPREVVVVGVDGSAGAKAALRWAIAEARLRQTRLRVVHAWTLAYAGVPGGGYGYLGGTLAMPSRGLSDMHEAAEELLDRAIAEIGPEADGVEIEREAVEGVAAGVLVEAAAAGDLLVVGSRGHGGFAGLLLGSVSQQCAHHARCPVVIVHTPKPSAGGSEATATAVASQPEDRPR